jgi:6-phosphofructokinase 1
MKTVGILTSGGDSPGMNACIAAIVTGAETLGWRSMGFRFGFKGLVARDTILLDEQLVLPHVARGGSILGTSRNGNLREQISNRGADDVLNAAGIDVLFVLGGGGSLQAAALLASGSKQIIGIPCTIDNDVPGSEYSLGFDSACNRVIRAADEIVDTGGTLPGRTFVIETLGGVTGHIALSTAYACQADAVFVPEVEPEIETICARIKHEMDFGKPYALFVVAEGVGAYKVAPELEKLVGRRVRVTALGHTQRGGNPTYFERKMARRFGEEAVRLAQEEVSSKMVAMVRGEVEAVELPNAEHSTRGIDEYCYRRINRL